MATTNQWYYNQLAVARKQARELPKSYNISFHLSYFTGMHHAGGIEYWEWAYAYNELKHLEQSICPTS